MGILTTDMQRVITEQRLGFVATVCSDGTPNLSPKGTTAVWDDDHLVFADISSPQTITNLRANPAIEINVVDPVVRKGYRFKGTGTVMTDGPEFEEVLQFFRDRGVVNPISGVVLVHVSRVQGLDSPSYDLGLTKAQVRERWENYWSSLRANRPAPATGE